MSGALRSPKTVGGRYPALAMLALGTLLTLLACSSPEPRGSELIVPTTPLNSLYVSPNGDDSGTGQKDSPFKTIEHAATVATPGTTVLVADGTYTGSLVTRTSGQPNARIAYISEQRGGAKIVGDGSGAAWQNTGDYVDIEGFDISGNAGDGLSDAGSYVRLADNRVHGFGNGNCISTVNNNYTLHDIDVTGNIVTGCGNDSQDHGIYVSHTGGNVSNNMSYGNSGFGIHCWHNCNRMTIANNLVFKNDSGGIIVGQGDSPNYGRVKADDCLVVNNIAIGNDGPGISEYGETGDKNRFINNNTWDNSDDGMDLQTGKESGTLNSDPQFVNYQPDGSGDYRLAPSSPNLHAGTTTGAPPTDILGVSRYRDSGVDIGIYEQ